MATISKVHFEDMEQQDPNRIVKTEIVMDHPDRP